MLTHTGPVCAPDNCQGWAKVFLYIPYSPECRRPQCLSPMMEGSLPFPSCWLEWGHAGWSPRSHSAPWGTMEVEAMLHGKSNETGVWVLATLTLDSLPPTARIPNRNKLLSWSHYHFSFFCNLELNTILINRLFLSPFYWIHLALALNSVFQTQYHVSHASAQKLSVTSTYH